MATPTDQTMHDQACALREAVFRLNLAYLLTARELLVADEPVHAEILFGLQEPLASWLKAASIDAVTTLARSPALLYAPRLGGAVATVLGACEEANTPPWLAPLHLALRAVAA